MPGFRPEISKLLAMTVVPCPGDKVPRNFSEPGVSRRFGVSIKAATRPDAELRA